MRNCGSGAAVSDSARQGDFAAAGLAGQVLDHGFRAIEVDRAIGVRESVGQAHQMERRVLQLQAAVDRGLRSAAGDRGVQRDRAGRNDIGAEGFQHVELDIAIGAEVDWMRGVAGWSADRRGAADRQIGVRTSHMKTLHRDDRVGERSLDVPGVVHLELDARRFGRAGRDRVGLQFGELQSAAQGSVRAAGPETVTCPSSDASKGWAVADRNLLRPDQVTSVKLSLRVDRVAGRKIEPARALDASTGEIGIYVEIHGVSTSGWR